MPSEIERKFLVTAAPDPIGLGPGVRLRQGYLALDQDVEVRIRLTDDDATLTIKAGAGLHRTEVEVAAEPAAAAELWALTRTRRIEKVRHRVPLDGDLVAEVDRYEGALDGLWTVEVELPTERAAASFTPPAWFGEELTGRAGWSNAALALDGRPSSYAALVIEAAGGAVWRTTGKGAVKVLLVHRSRYDDWSLPKGKLEAEETHRQAALREVEEETGFVCTTGVELPEVRYHDRKDRPKRVRYWAMEIVSGAFAPNDEVDEIRWLLLDDATALISYEHDAIVIDSLRRLCR